MKKIAIQTLQLTNNYGGILQAFALQYYLEELGYKVTHLNRVNRPSAIILKLKIILFKLSNQSFFRAEKRVNTIFSSFLNEYINLSETLYTMSEWKNYIKDNKIDLVIVGSDQVWRLEYIKDLYPEFFLDFKFLDTKKASYAASFGVTDFENNNVKEIKNLLSDFSGLSVREDSAKLFLKELLEKGVYQHIDPTLLLTSKQYIEKFKLEDKIKKDDLFCYILDKSKIKQNIIQNINEKLNLDLLFVYGSAVNLDNYRDPEILSKPNIESWLQGFLSSKFIITDSFHGMVFSIIFNKPFIVIANLERGVSRFTSLLSILGLEERLININEEWDEEIINKEIDFNKINSLVEKEQKRSKEYLVNLLV